MRTGSNTQTATGKCKLQSCRLYWHLKIIIFPRRILSWSKREEEPECLKKETGSKEARAARVLTPGDAEGAKVGGGGGIGKGEEARVEARRRAADARAGAARQEGSDGDGEEEQQGGGRAMGGVEAGVGGRDEGGVHFPGLGLVVLVPGGGGAGGGRRGRAGGAGGEADVVHADGTGRGQTAGEEMEQDPPKDIRCC